MSRHWIRSTLEATVVLFLAASAVLQIHTTDAARWEGGRQVHDLLVLGFTLPLLVRRRHPVAALLAVFASAWLQLELGGLLQQPFFAWLLALYAVGAHARPPATYTGPAVVAILALNDVPRMLDGLSWSEVLPGWFMSVGVWGLGRWIRHRRAEAEALEASTAAARREAEQRAATAVADERARIARELHDLVSHNIGVVVLQAQGAQRSLDHDPERARAALESIERAGRDGLGEMRRLLGLLTGPGPVAPDEPQPSLRMIDDLVEQVRAAGTPVDLEVRGTERELGPGPELTAFRVVQEALTNAIKHAPGAPVRVVVDYAPDGVHLAIEDDGATTAPDTVESGGQGIVGMRERVALYGGDLVTGPRPDGGFAVSARIPVEGPR